MLIKGQYIFAEKQNEKMPLALQSTHSSSNILGGDPVSYKMQPGYKDILVIGPVYRSNQKTAQTYSREWV